MKKHRAYKRPPGKRIDYIYRSRNQSIISDKYFQVGTRQFQKKEIGIGQDDNYSKEREFV